MQKIDQLTFTRFIAAMMVVVYHSGRGVLPFALFPINHFFASSGFSAVTYFFVLSGFIMAYAYYRPEEKFRFGAYWQARIARIYPVFLFSLLLTFWYYREGFLDLFGRKLLANVLLVQAWIPRYVLSFNIPAWSLSIEMFFYFLFPFLALFACHMRARTVIWVSIIFWFASQIVHMTLLQLYMPDERFILLYNPIFHLDSFLLGMAGGIWYLNEAPRLRVSPRVKLVLLSGAVLSVCALMIADSLKRQSFYFADSGFLAPLFLIIVLTIALDQTRLSAIFRKPMFVLLGNASYSVYILHIPVRWLLEQYRDSHTTILSHPYVFFYGYFFLIIGLSVLVFRWIEVPSRKFLRDFFQRAFPPPPLLWLDMLLVLMSIVLSFFLRHGTAMLSGRAAVVRENIYQFLIVLILLLLVRWIVFTFTQLYAKIDRPAVFIEVVKMVFWSVSLGSIFGSVGWFLLYKVGLLTSFSKSILLMEWAFSSGFVFLVHYGSLKLRQVVPVSA